MKKTFLLGAVALALAFAAPARAAEGGHDDLPHRESWSFAGPFGMYDPAQLQRGFKVFREVCASCHSANYLYFRNLRRKAGRTSPKPRPRRWRPSIRSPMVRTIRARCSSAPAASRITGRRRSQ